MGFFLINKLTVSVMDAKREAQDLAIASASELRYDDLKTLPKNKMGEKKYFRDKDSKLVRRVALSNFDSKLKIGTLPYKNYDDWSKRGGYHSDQWCNFDLQCKLFLHAQKKTGNTFYSINEQEKFEVNEMPLFPLDIEKDILDDFTVVLIGRRRSGKTYLSRWLMYHLRFRFPFGIVITGTRENNFWAQYVPEEFIHDIEDIGQVLGGIFARQTFIAAHPELGIDPRMFVILDDVMGNKYRTRFSSELSTIFTDGRHKNLFLLITLQDAKGIPPDLRENTDACFTFRVYEGGRKQVICEEWLSYIEEMKTIQAFSNTERTRMSKQKQHTCMQFFWKNTGLLDKETCEPFKEDRNTTDEDRKKAVPQAIAVLQARTTEDLQAVMKKAVAEDPGPFLLGDKRYYKASQTGNYKPLVGTYKEFKRRGKRRFTNEGLEEQEQHKKSSSSSGEDNSSDEEEKRLRDGPKPKPKRNTNRRRVIK